MKDPSTVHDKTSKANTRTIYRIHQPDIAVPAKRNGTITESHQITSNCRLQSVLESNLKDHEEGLVLQVDYVLSQTLKLIRVQLLLLRDNQLLHSENPGNRIHKPPLLQDICMHYPSQH